MGIYFTEMQKKANGGTEQTCRLVESKLDPELLKHFQIIPSRVSELLEDKIRVYWLHDLPHDPETKHLADPNSRDRFHKLIFCGNWQCNQYVNFLGVPQNQKIAVLETPIVPIDLDWSTKDSEQIRLIYTSTPQRGLALLAPVFDALSKEIPNLHLDVFSSFQIYGWTEADKQFEELFNWCKTHPNVTYHGSQPNEVVREYLQKAHIFSYPSIWQECNSRALIEAMSAGLLCVHPNYAGLADTAGGLTAMYQFTDDVNYHCNMFYQLLKNACTIVKNEQTKSYLRFVKAYADSRFNIDKIASQWTGILEDLVHQYPEGTRALPKAMFRYST